MYTYIIVDDEPLVRKGTIKKLAGIKNILNCTAEASNGSEAIDLIEEKDPDIVITDMNMPVMNGIEFLKLLTKKYPGKQIIVISGYKDFDYTRQAITANAVDYILKPFSREDITRCIKSAINKLKEKDTFDNKLASSEQEKENARYKYDIEIIRNLILGYDVSESNFTSHRISSFSNGYNYTLITLYSSNGIKANNLNTFLTENNYGDFTIVINHSNNDKIKFLIVFSPIKNALDPKRLCTGLASKLSTVLNAQKLNHSIGISELYNELKYLNKSFQDTIIALNSQLVNENNNIFYYDNKNESPKSFTWENYEEFMFRIETGELEKIDLLINELFTTFCRNNKYTLYDVKYYLIELTNNTKNILVSYYDDININKTSSSMQKILNNMFNLNEIKSYYRRFFFNISDMLKEKSVYQSDDIIDKVKTYIKRNYNKNLTVEFVASLFYINRSYLSHLFKKQSGISFVDFLNTTRINNAKKLLEKTNKKMYQIAKMVGYDNVKYFFRIFKKYEKTTPKQYKEKYKIK